VDNCQFIDNTAASGGGIMNYYSNMKLSNSYFSNNTASQHGGGIFNMNLSNLTVMNCTFTRNHATWGGGISSSGSDSNEIIKNCIIWGNSADQVHGIEQPGIAYSDIQNGWEGIGNIDADPLFADDGFNLRGVSPCIDAGDPNYTPDINETDIEGDPRVVGIIDMGADEVYSGASPFIIMTPGNQNFEAEGLNSGSQSRQISIRNHGTGVLVWQLSEPNGCSWLSEFPSTGQVGPGESNDIEITINPNIAGYGIHSCELHVTAPDAENSPLVSTVNLEVLGPKLVISDSVFDFNVTNIGSGTLPQILTIQNAGFDNLNWHIEIPSDCTWLSVFPASGQVNSGESNDVSITVNPSIAGYGAHSCQLLITAAGAQGSPQAVTVNLDVLRPAIGVNKTSFNFTAHGKSDTSVASQQLVISNTGYDTLNWRIEIPDCNWLIANPSSGQVTDGNNVVLLTVDPSKAPAYGTNNTTINIIDANASNSPKAVSVQLQANGPSIYVSPPSYIYAERNTRVEETFVIQNSGYDILHWNIDAPNDGNWLDTVEPLSGQCAAGQSEMVTITVDTNGLNNGQYQTTIPIHSPEATTINYYIYLTVYTSREIHVPRDYSTIQAAINAALTGDIIVVHPGKYAGFNGNKAALTIQSIDPENPAIVAATIIESPGQSSGPETVIKGLSFIYNTISPNPPPYGLYINVLSDMRIENCRVLNFPKTGIRVAGESSVVTVEKCVIMNNGYLAEYGSGGGIAVSGFVNIDNCLIAGNFRGGIMYGSSNNWLNINNSTIANNYNNTTKASGYAIAPAYQKADINLTLNNSIISNKIGPNDVEIYGAIGTCNIDIEYSNLRGGQAAIYMPIDGVLPSDTINWGQGNIDIDPCFARPDGWLDNNTPGDTNDDMYIGGDYHLKSSAGRWEWNKLMDMDAQGDGFLDMQDFAVLAGEWQKTSAVQAVARGYPYPYYRYLRADLDKSGRVDLADLVIFCENYLNHYDMGQCVHDDANSACIDAGDPNSDWSKELWPHGKRINMGAYGGTAEASTSLSDAGNIADIDNSGMVDINDLRLFTEQWLKKGTLNRADLNLNLDVEFIDFSIFAENWCRPPE
jgi:hypothetical protein